MIGLIYVILAMAAVLYLYNIWLKVNKPGPMYKGSVNNRRYYDIQ